MQTRSGKTMLLVMSAEAVLNFRVPAQPHLARVVRQVASAFATENGIDVDDLGQFLTALGEAVANAIEHARTETGIEIEVTIDHNAIVGTVQDAGVGFASDALVSPRLPGADAERGRGLAIMRRCSDIFDVKSAPGKGTAVVVGRYLRRLNGKAHIAVGEVHFA